MAQCACSGMGGMHWDTPEQRNPYWEVRGGRQREAVGDVGSWAVGSNDQPCSSATPRYQTQQLHTSPGEGFLPGPERLFPNESKDNWIFLRWAHWIG